MFAAIAPPADAQEPADSARDAATASLGGVVLDVRTRLPLRGARIDVEGTIRYGTTDENGHFEIVDLAPGLRTFRVRFREWSTGPQRVELEPSWHTEIRVGVTVPAADPPRGPDVVALPELEVEITRSDGASKLRGFLRRSRGGRGVFITREEIESRAPDRTSDLLFGIQGLRVRPSGGGVAITSNRGCVLPTFLDGLPVRGMTPDEVPPQDIAAIEIYRTPNETPGEFRRFSGCGAIVIWTLDP